HLHRKSILASILRASAIPTYAQSGLHFWRMPGRTSDRELGSSRALLHGFVGARRSDADLLSGERRACRRRASPTLGARPPSVGGEPPLVWHLFLCVQRH